MRSGLATSPTSPFNRRAQASRTRVLPTTASPPFPSIGPVAARRSVRYVQLRYQPCRRLLTVYWHCSFARQTTTSLSPFDPIGERQNGGSVFAQDPVARAMACWAPNASVAIATARDPGGSRNRPPVLQAAEGVDPQSAGDRDHRGVFAVGLLVLDVPAAVVADDDVVDPVAERLRDGGVRRLVAGGLASGSFRADLPT